MTKRPSRTDDSVVMAAAKKIAPDVKRWLGHDDTTRIEDIERDLVEALKWNDDGYDIAKQLDGTYTPDAELVEILDGLAWEKGRALERECIAWVQANGSQAITKGTKVTWARKPQYGVGVVSSNYPDGRAVVNFASLGQKDGEGYIVEWEQLTEVGQ